MIVEFIVNCFCGLLDGVFLTVNFVSIPVNGIQVLGTFVSYGASIIGADLLLLFCSTVMMWSTLKLSLGLILFMWRLLPFT